MTKSRVIIALDFKNKADVLEFLDKFDEPLFVKVGMELFYGDPSLEVITMFFRT